MPIDTSRQIAFIHVPKTGGTSIEKMFGLYGDETTLFDSDPQGAEPQHWTYERITEEYDLSDCFTFAFVRHPLDRLVSEWHWRRRSLHREAGRFERFLWRACDAVRRGTTDPHLRPQADFFPAGALDFVGRFERFATDVARVMDHIGVEGCIRHTNASDRAEWRCYFDEMTRREVEWAYAVDFERFDYTT